MKRQSLVRVQPCVYQHRVTLLQQERRGSQGLSDLARWRRSMVLSWIRAKIRELQDSADRPPIREVPPEPSEPQPDPVFLLRKVRDDEDAWQNAKSWFGGLPAI